MGLSGGDGEYQRERTASRAEPLWAFTDGETEAQGGAESSPEPRSPPGLTAHCRHQARDTQLGPAHPQGSRVGVLWAL